MKRIGLWTWVGTAVAMLTFATGSLATAKRHQAPRLTVELYLSTDCPVARKATPRIKALMDEFEPQGVAFKAYFPNELETADALASHLKDRGYRFPATLDLGGERAKRFGVKIVPTAVVLDPNGKVLYHGPIDDHKEPHLVRQRHLYAALSASLTGKPVPAAKVEAFGCVLMPGTPLPEKGKVTYAEHTKAILDRSCLPCHRTDEVAPFSLVGYTNARKWAQMIQIVTESKKMPPWKAVHGYGYFLNENRLTEVEIELLKRWAEGGAPRGDQRAEPPTPRFEHQEWSLGQPDLTLKPTAPYRLAADGQDDYRHFILKTNFNETKWIKSMAVKPGNKQVVHHVIAFIDEKGVSHRLDGKDGQVGYSTFGGVGFLPDGSLGGWAPGNNAFETPEGKAFELKPGASIVMQIHYHRTGKEEVDLTQLGLYFAKPEEKIEKAVALSWMAKPTINIPAGEAAHVERATFPVPADITLYSLMPHMHLLGKEMRADVEYPDGETKPLIYVKDWDFNWQLSYAFIEPLEIPKGSKLHVTAVFDNSSANRNNPSNPPKAVRWGEETTDEMFLLVGMYTVKDGLRPGRAMIGFAGPERP